MNKLSEYRREFHKYPENGWHEFRTSARVAEILTGMGYEVAMGPDVIEPASVGEPERLTQEQVKAEMERAVAQGANPDFVARTNGWPGVMAVLDTGRPGPVSAMRFEIDCLPYDEPQKAGYRPFDEGYLSCNPQSVHACGHDGHTAIGLISTIGYLPEVFCPFLAGVVLDTYSEAGYKYYFLAMGVIMLIGILGIMIWNRSVKNQKKA